MMKASRPEMRDLASRVVSLIALPVSSCILNGHSNKENFVSRGEASTMISVLRRRLKDD
jgi:hypothetical protein